MKNVREENAGVKKTARKTPDLRYRGKEIVHHQQKMQKMMAEALFLVGQLIQSEHLICSVIKVHFLLR